MLGLVELEQTRAYQQGLEIGEERGEKLSATRIAAKLLQAGMPIQEVATFTNLSEQELRQIQNNPGHPGE